jgi:chromatin structure-remodeling complex subunit RSC1/2
MSLLKPDDKIVAEGDKLPDPMDLGSEDAPPTIGAIYRGDSPEPEKEPTPPPPPPQPVITEQRLEPLSSIAPSLPQPMPYKNPITHMPHSMGGGGSGLRPLPPQRYQSMPSRQQQTPSQAAPLEQPLAFTMPVSVPPEVAELVHRDAQGRVLWFGVPPVDIVGWGGGEGVKGHTLEYLAKKRKRNQVAETMEDVKTVTVEDKGFKKRATEILAKALGMIGK